MARRKSQINNADEILATVSHGLIALEGAEIIAQKTSHDVFELVKSTYTEREVVRFHLKGAAGTQSTTWILPEYCCVIFLDFGDLSRSWKSSQFVQLFDEKAAEIMDKWKEILNENDFICSESSDNLFVSLSGGLKVTIRVGLDASVYYSEKDVELTPEKTFQSLSWKQASGLLELFKKLPNEQDRIDIGKTQLKHSFCELNSAWLKGQSQKAHQLIRIVKLWVTSCCPFELKTGTKMRILESVAIEVTSNVLSIEPYKLVGAFRKFLDLLADHLSCRKLQIEHKEKLLFGSYLQKKPDKNKPYIIDPCNPHNNLLQGIDEKDSENLVKFLDKCATQAKRSLEVFDGFVRNNDPIDGIFLVSRNMEIHGIQKPKHMIFKIDEDPCFFPVLSNEFGWAEAKKLGLAMSCLFALVPRSSTSGDELVSELADLVRGHMKIKTSPIFADRSLPEVSIRVPLSKHSSLRITCGLQID